MGREYQVTINDRELCIIQDALNAYGRAYFYDEGSQDQGITDIFDMLSKDQEDYTIDEVRYLWRSLQSRYKKEDDN